MSDAARTPRTLFVVPRPRARAVVTVLCGALAALSLAARPAWSQAATPRRAGAPVRRPTLFERHREALYLSGAAGGVAANAIWKYHPGARFGPDMWFARDKALHGGASATLTLAGIGAGVRPWVAASTVCAAGAAFELTEARTSGKDITVNCASAATAWGWSLLARRLHINANH